MLITRKIHDLLFPKIDFKYNDYCRRQNVEPVVIHGFLNVSEALQAASDKQRRVHRAWNNAKCDALSLYAFSTWSEPDDIFVTRDGDFDKEKLKEPFVIEMRVLVPPPGTPWPSEEPISLIEQAQTIPLSGVIKGQIMTPHEAEKYLRKWLEEESEVHNASRINEEVAEWMDSSVNASRYIVCIAKCNMEWTV